MVSAMAKNVGFSCPYYNYMKFTFADIAVPVFRAFIICITSTPNTDSIFALCTERTRSSWAIG